jgi:hypothetical protein
MNRETTTMKLYLDTRKKLRLLAALLDKSMMDVMDQLVDKALIEVQHETSQGIQVQNLPDRKPDR